MRFRSAVNRVLRMFGARLIRTATYHSLQQTSASRKDEVTILQEERRRLAEYVQEEKCRHEGVVAALQAEAKRLAIDQERQQQRRLPDYQAKCLEIFGRHIAVGDNCLFWSFDRESPESERLFCAMSAIKCECMKKYMETIQTEKVEGAIVEFGVFDGGTLKHIVEKCEQLGLATPIFGFDSFEGLPNVTQHDLSCFQAGQFAASLNDVARTLKCQERPQVHLVKGWFSETLASKAIATDPALRQIAFAHIDCDVYSSAVDCLKFIESRLTNGAFLIFDDWVSSELYGETKAFFEWYDKIRHLYRFEHVASLERGSLQLRVWLK